MSIPKALTENSLIQLLSGQTAAAASFSKSSILLANGDDAACYQLNGPSLVTTDQMVEGVHFRTSTYTAKDVGRKLLLSNLSDLSAKGGKPRFAFLNAAFPASISERWVRGFARGLHRELRSNRIGLLGGDTTKSPRHIFLSLTLIGEQCFDTLPRRQGSQCGDLIWVSGTLGDSLAGWRLLEKHGASKAKKTPAARRLIKCHHVPPNRLALGQALVEAKVPTAMMDLSDGLALDLSRLSGGAGACIFENQIPLSPELQKCFPENYKTLALQGGEDYELLFTTNPLNATKVFQIGRSAGVALTPVGEMTSGPNLRVVNRYGRLKSFPKPAFNHFESDA